MRDDVVIGEGNPGNSWSGINFEGTDHRIMEGQRSYIVSDGPLDIRMVIMKDTEEGRYIRHVIVSDAPPHALDSYLESLAFKHITPAKLKEKIKAVVDAAYRKGQEDKAFEIRNALGVALWR